MKTIKQYPNIIFHKTQSLFVSLFMLFALTAIAQNKPINCNNIFATSYTYVGIPHGDTLCVLGLKENKWHQLYSLKIPKNIVALDGNESRIFYLTDNNMIVQEYYNCDDMCGKDTLHLSDVKGKILPENWLRAISSTESDFTVFNFSALQYYHKDGGSWHTKMFSDPFEKTEKKDPKFYINMPYQKMMSFDDDMYIVTKQGQDLRFWIFDPGNILEKVPQLKKELTPTEKLNITLPKGVLSFFVYDKNNLAWVYNDRIEFYRFNKEKSAWEKTHTPDLKFGEVLSN